MIYDSVVRTDGYITAEHPFEHNPWRSPSCWPTSANGVLVMAAGVDRRVLMDVLGHRTIQCRTDTAT